MKKIVPVPILLVLTIVLCCGAQSWAAPAAKQADDAEEKVQYGEVTGTVSAVNKVGIAVEHSRTRTGASEMYLPFSAHVKLERLRSLAELQLGATVKVRYEQVYKEGEKEDQQTILKTVATHISLIRSAPPEGTLVSQEEATE